MRQQYTGLQQSSLVRTGRDKGFHYPTAGTPDMATLAASAAADAPETRRTQIITQRLLNPFSTARVARKEWVCATPSSFTSGAMDSANFLPNSTPH